MSEVWLPPEKHSDSQTDLPRMVPPASRIRSTTVASASGTYPSRVTVPFIIGTPATQTLSFSFFPQWIRTIARVFPASGPAGAPSMRLLTYQAP